MTKVQAYLSLGAILILGLVLRFYHNTDISLWHDEAFSALLIKYPWSEMLYRIGLDVHPPIYYFALRLWHYLLGDSLLALRSFSVFFGLATALVTFLLTKTVTKNYGPALLSALLIAVNPFQIQYATEARMYTFGAFLGLLCAYLLVTALSLSKTKASPLKKSIFWIGFGIISGLTALTHYYLLFTVAGLFLYGLLYHVYYYKTQAKAYLWLLLSYLLTALIFLPWTSWFLYQFKQVGAGYWIPPMDKWSVPTTLWHILIGAGVDISKSSGQVISLLAVLLVLVILIKICTTKTEHKWLLIFGFLAPFGGALLFLLLSIINGSDSSVYLVRYFLYASGFLSALMAIWFFELKPKMLAKALLVLLLLGNLYTFYNYWQKLEIQKKPGMKALSAHLIQNVKTEDIILVASSFEYFNLKYYLSQSSQSNAGEPVAGDCSIDCLSFSATPRPLLYSGGKTSTDQMSHFEGTAILTNQDLFPNFSAIKPQTTVWLVWTNGFGGSQPDTPTNWIEVSETGFAEVRPYVGTWVVVTKYLVN